MTPDMTHEELMALPENGAFDEIRIYRGDPDFPVSDDPGALGDVFIKRVARKAYVLCFKPEDPIYHYDKHGFAWQVGLANGEKMRQRISWFDR
jgi:hypothetical protein